jgi:hypothetical protein
MQPEVLAWTVLFVVAFAIVYRLVSAIARRLRTKPPAGAVAEQVRDIAEMQSTRPALRIVEIPIPSVRASPTTPAESEPIADDAAALIIEAPPVAAAQTVSVPEPPADSAAVISKDETAPAVRIALAPSVAATLPPVIAEPVMAPEPPAEISSPDAVEENILLNPEPLAVSDTFQTTSDEDPRALDEAQSFGTMQLRARRIGPESLSLDRRLRYSRERRMQKIPRTVAKAVEFETIRVLRVLVPKASRVKVPARRIGQRDSGPLAFTSIRGRERIIGARRHPFRVLPALSMRSQDYVGRDTSAFESSIETE